MKREYWNGLANRYEKEVFDVLGNDKKHQILGLI
jgi:SAM-dependent methyltransferase